MRCTCLEVSGSFLGVVSLVVAGGVQGGTHLDNLEVILQLGCDLLCWHVKPCLASRLLSLSLRKDRLVMHLTQFCHEL